MLARFAVSGALTVSIEINAALNEIRDLTERVAALRGYLDYAGRKERLEEVERELEDPELWSEAGRAQALNQERAELAGVVETIDSLTGDLTDLGPLLELAAEEDDAETFRAVEDDIVSARTRVEALEFRRMFSGEMDNTASFLEIQSGAGGTEAQDWADMLLRMYLRWAESHERPVEIIETSPGEVAGIKSATVRIGGEYAYGWLRTETGVHRLVRKSPFDSGNRRHTSFASVFVSPEVDDDIDIDVDPSDLRVDVYRASGAGGQHVNRTESAVRLTHLPTNVVVQCQNDRSQHKNKATAMKQLKAKLYELELRKRREEAQAVEDAKSDVGWGSQIRSYVLDQSRIKDLRTGFETGNTQAVLDGGLDGFIEASLKQGL
ncbi:MAG: peptide chain release factor 2 [Pseudomonadota bacterium]